MRGQTDILCTVFMPKQWFDGEGLRVEEGWDEGGDGFLMENSDLSSHAECSTHAGRKSENQLGCTHR